MTEKKKRQQQKPASAGKKKPAAAGKRIFAKPPDLTRGSDAEMREFVVNFLRGLGSGSNVNGDGKKGAPDTGGASTDGKGA